MLGHWLMKLTEAVRNADRLVFNNTKHLPMEDLNNVFAPVTEAMSKNKLALFSRPQVKTSFKEELQLAALKNDCKLFSRLYMLYV